MTRILVTGASSYLGSRLARLLHTRKHDVHIVVRSSTLPGRLPADISANRVHLHDGSAAMLHGIVRTVAPEVVYHLASYYTREPSPSEVDPMVVSNFSFGVQLLEGLRRLERPVRFITAGSHAQFFETVEPRPLNLYAACKQSFQTMLAYYTDSYDFHCSSLILFDTYGPDDWRVKFLNAAIEAAVFGRDLPLPDVEVGLDLVHIDDVALAFEVAGLPAAIPGTYAISSGKVLGISEVLALIEEISGKPVRITRGAYTLPTRRILNPWRGPILPGWSPRISLADTISAMIDARRD